MTSDPYRFVFHHVFLPPELPQSDHDESGAPVLLREMSIAAQRFSRQVPAEARDVLPTFSQWAEVYGDGTPCAETIIDALKNMGSKGDKVQPPYNQSNRAQKSFSSTCDHRMPHF